MRDPATLDVATSGYHSEHKHILITSASLRTLGSPPTGEGSRKMVPCTHSLYRSCTNTSVINTSG